MSDKKLKIYHKFFRFLLKHDIKGVRFLADRLPKKFLNLPKNEVVIETLGGSMLTVNPAVDKTIDPFLYYYGVYEWGTLNVIEKLLKPNNTFVDVGANVGIISLFASRLLNKNGKVIAFEPLPSSFEMLENNIRLNNIKNIETFPYACSNNLKTKYISLESAENRGGASLKTNIENSSTSVKSIILDDFLEIIPDFIKIDVEGHELEVLEGLKNILSSKKPPILIVESSSETETQNSSPERIYNFLKEISSNYKIYKLKGAKVRPSKLIEVKSKEMLPNDDNIFCFPKVKNYLVEKLVNS